MVKKADIDIKGVIVDKAMALAENQGWGRVMMSDIAREAGLSMPELFDIVLDKFDILALLGRQIDRRVLSGMGEPDPALSERDLLFDILMERFEILNDYRGGILAVLESIRFDPKQALVSCPHLCRSMTWMLEAAGIETSGVRGAVRVAGFTGIYLKTLRVWASDESADLAKVMAALDKDLGRAERAAGMLGL